MTSIKQAADRMGLAAIVMGLIVLAYVCVVFFFEAPGLDYLVAS